MSKFASFVSATAFIALAAVPALALTQSAQAAEPAARIAVGNLNSPSQASVFQAQLTSEADRVCTAMEKAPESGSKIRVSHASCVQEFRSEALAQISNRDRASVQMASAASTVQVAGR